MPATAQDLNLAELIAEYHADPLGFSLDCFPWGEPGELAHSPGPDTVQCEFLEALGKEIRARNFDPRAPVPVLPVRMCESSGHGTGKSALGGILAAFILSTRPGSIGTVTAGTSQQLEARTWTAIRKWINLCITREWFEVQARGIYARPHVLPPGMTAENWKLVAQTCKEENAQSFAGQHADTSTSWYLFDEASRVPDGIWEVAYGGLTDGEPMMFVWGQMERNTGEFYRVCYGDLAHRWNHRNVDSRASRFTSKEFIDELIRDYGLDSDMVRVRVLGLPPRASELQFIDWQRIRDAGKRLVMTLPDDPLIAGVDCSDGGAAWNVCRFRRGFDARSIPPIRIAGEKTRNDPHVLTARLAEVLRETSPEKRISAMFIDAAFGAAIAERLNSMGFRQVHTVRFGGASPDPDCLNWRAAMWKSMKDWLQLGAIADEQDDRRLPNDLSGPGFHLNQTAKLVIESKADMTKRGVRSPDDGDALALTFAQPVVVQPRHSGAPRYKPASQWS